MAMLRNSADRLHRARIERIGRILRNESAMRLHLRNAKQFREVRHLPQRIDARRARLWRNQPDRRRPMRKSHSSGWGPTTSTVVAVTSYFASKSPNLLCRLRREFVDVPIQREKTVCEAHVVNALDSVFRMRQTD